MQTSIRIASFAACVVCATAPMSAADPPETKVENATAALARNLVGEWQGDIPCNGRAVFRADGTFRITEFGPGAVDRGSGQWKLQGDLSPPVLLLKWKTSLLPEEVGRTTEAQLDDANLGLEFLSRGQPDWRANYERVVQPAAPWGLVLDEAGTTVAQVVPDGPAAKAGIRRGDRLLSLGETKIGGIADVADALRGTRPGDKRKVRLRRGELEITLTVQLVAPPGP